MNNLITWKYVKPLKDTVKINEFEAKVGVTFPLDLKQIILENNGGRPSLRYYDFKSEKDKEFKSLLSFNEDDVENIYQYFPLDSKEKKLIPFASDPAGNLFVLQDNKICLWYHEIDKVEIIASSFTKFLSILHD